MTEKQIQNEIEKLEEIDSENINYNPIIEEVKRDYKLILLSGLYSIIKLPAYQEVEYLGKIRAANNPNYKKEDVA